MKFNLNVVTVLKVSFTRVFHRITRVFHWIIATNVGCFSKTVHVTTNRELKFPKYLIWTLFVCWEKRSGKCEHNNMNANYDIFSAEAAFRRFSVKKIFLKISKNWQENTCARVSFSIKLQVLGLQLCLKRDSGTGVFLWFLQNF